MAQEASRRPIVKTALHAAAAVLTAAAAAALAAAVVLVLELARTIVLAIAVLAYGAAL